MTLLALDFDGVLCDSARETAISGWRAGAAIWPDMSAPLPPDDLIQAYRLARPMIETGHEAILVMRLLKDGDFSPDFLEGFPEHKARLMREAGRDREDLARLYGVVRDHWIKADAEEWSAMSPLYPGVSAFLENPPALVDEYIITTKQERFVRRLLDYNGIRFPTERIFGLDRDAPKETVLLDLLTRYPDRRLYFIEDRLATLTRVMARPELAVVRPYLADWGYNTRADRESASELGIPTLNLHGLLALTFLEDNK